MPTVWIISEGSPGHISQSVGVADSLGELLPVKSTLLETRPRLGGFSRQLVRLWLGARPRQLPGWFARRWLKVGAPPAGERPDLIIASGGKSVFAAQSLAGEHRVPLVFLGERKPYPSEWFHTVFTPSQAERGVHDEPIEMIPTQITPALAAQAANQWSERPPGHLWAMIIGGPSASHRYADADWAGLAAGVNALAPRHGIRWLLTTSRRTGAAVEARLQEQITPTALAKEIWWHTRPEKKMTAFLGAAERVFVTQDSVTMVTEAVASARPVHVLGPHDLHFSADSFLPGYFANLASAGRVQRIPMRELAQAPLTAEFKLRAEPVNREIALRLLRRLGWLAV